MNLFFAEQGDMDTVAAAKAVCRRCPVQPECLDFAITNNELSGIWGGFSRKDRRRIKKRRAA